MGDSIYIRSLSLSAHIGSDVWSRFRPQPVHISLRVTIPPTSHSPNGLQSACETDDIHQTLDYGKISKAILRNFGSDGKEFDGLEALAEEILKLPQREEFGSKSLSDRLEIEVKAEARKMILNSEGGLIVRTASGSGEGFPKSKSVTIDRLTLPAIIGVNPAERERKQRVVTSLTFVEPRNGIDYRLLMDEVSKVIDKTSFKTIEAFSFHVAREVFRSLQQSPKLGGNAAFGSVIIDAEKPSAVVWADATGVEIKRSWEELQRLS